MDVMTSESAARVLCSNNMVPGMEKLSIDEPGTEGLIRDIGQRLEMNIIKYGSQFTAIRQGLYDIVSSPGTLGDIKRIKALQSKIDKRLEGRFIIEYKDVEIPTIDGLITRLPIFTGELKNLFGHVTNSLSTLDDLDRIVADFIGLEDVRHSLIIFKANLITSKKFTTEVQDFVNRNISGKHETITLDKLVGNNNELKDTINNLVDMNKMFSNKELTKIEKKVEDIEARISLLIKVLKDVEEPKTKESLQHLLESVEEIGTYLTSLSAIYYFHVRSMGIVLKINMLLED